MKSFAVLLVAFQACVFQSAFGQCLRGAYTPTALPTTPCWDAPAPYWNGAAPGIAAPLAGPLGYNELGYGYRGACGSYGGAGIGNVAVAGELPVAGTTVLAGQVPIIGAVEFGGTACAAGGVSITGSCGCGCGCGNSYLY